MFPASHKTVIVIDHSPFFGKPCGHKIEYDMISKSRSGVSNIPIDPFYKSLWTCAVEAAFEYCRIVYDIFASDRLIRFIAADTEARLLNTWSKSDQQLSDLMHVFAELGPADPEASDDDCSIIHGLTAAVEVLCECSEEQHQIRTSMTDVASSVSNKGRIICFTSVTNDTHVEVLKKSVQDAIVQHNKMAAGSDNLLSINHCELTVFHVHVPEDSSTAITPKTRQNVSSNLSFRLISVPSAQYLASHLCKLVQAHHNLVMTTITGIPMKEEQNSNSSANYDVELLHHKDGHKEVRKSTSQSASSSGDTSLKVLGQEENNIILKWCSPRGMSNELLYCTGAYRISPVDVNSRPSLCLTNFLLNGRQVMLEQPRKAGAKVMSHMLTSHGGEIFIHCLSTSRSYLEDPPSISEGCGGRVTDYRITDFGEFMKDNRLAPFTTDSHDEELPIIKAKEQLERQTRLWPMVISDTIIFNMASHIDPLPTLIAKPVMDEEDITECKKSILHLVGIEAKGDPIPLPPGIRGKAPKKEEHYRQMWAELETLIKAYSNTSPAHQEVLKCLYDCKPSSDSNGKKGMDKSSAKGTEKASEAEKAWKDLDRLQSMTHREKQDFLSNTDLGNIEGTPPIKKQKITKDESRDRQKGGPVSLLSLWTSRIKVVNTMRHEEFAGRLEAVNNKTELYAHMKKDDN
ncbi:integrator complex subunit 13-like [Anneissia japonica]|uniref:integrator complex subunit 13-like n=1 Tax=Anneissia japonica TaxID=1529436 RepID=UPI0014258310|nr:integrator complex subunit 13-like [Anneissia japonica]